MISPLKLVSVSLVTSLSLACSDDGGAEPLGTGAAPSTSGGMGTGGTGAGGTPTGGTSAGGTPAAGSGGMPAAGSGGMPAAGAGGMGGGAETPACMPIMAPAGSMLGAPKLVIAEIALGGAEEHIVVYNNSMETLELAGYGLCSNFIYYETLDKLTDATSIEPGAFVTLEVSETFTGLAMGSPEKGELLIFEGEGAPVQGDGGADVEDYVCWGIHEGGRKDLDGGEMRYAGDCAPAMTAGALRRKPGTSGEDAASYDGAVTPDACSM